MNTPIQSILLVDDDLDDKYFFSMALEEIHPEIKLQTASDGAEAFERLNQAEPDIILLDLIMPGMSGVTFLKKIKQHPLFKNIPVIVYTSSLSIFEEPELKKLGAKDVFMKAPDFGGTLTTISEILDVHPLRKSA